MSKCDLSIELDRQPPAYRPGETVRGKLHVFVNDDCRCDSLTVTLQWRTHGKGNKDKGPELMEPLGAFHWNPGESSTHEFAFTMPEGPVSYHGQIVNVDWYILARADVPWAIDPKAEHDILLLAAEPQSTSSNTYRGGPGLAPRHHDLGPAVRGGTQPPWMKFGAVGLFFAFFFVFFGKHLFEDGRPNLMLFGFFAFALVMTGRMFWTDVRNMAAKRRIGDIRLSVEPSATMRGQSIQIRAALDPLSDARMSKVTATLVGDEVAVSGSGTSRTTHTHSLDRVSEEMASGIAVKKGQPVELTCSLKVPDHAAPTFRAEDNKVRWQLIVHFDIDAWPDLEERLEIDVLPS